METKNKETVGRGKFVLRYFEWGHEKPGYVSTWRLVGDNGDWKLCGHHRRESLPQNAIFDCPFS